MVVLVEWFHKIHYNDSIMSATASQIIGVTIVHLIVWSGAAQRKHQSSASLAFVWGINRWQVSSLHKGPVTRKCFHLLTSSCGGQCTNATFPFIYKMWLWNDRLLSLITHRNCVLSVMPIFILLMVKSANSDIVTRFLRNKMTCF